MNSIALNVENEKHFSSRIEKFFSRYQIGSILKQCNAYKKQGVPVVQIVRYLFMLVFLNRSMFLDMRSEKSPNFGKDTVYRFKNADHTNWMKFTTLLSGRIIRDTIMPTISADRKCAFILSSIISVRRNDNKYIRKKSWDRRQFAYPSLD